MQNANGGGPNLYASIDVIPEKGTNGLWSQNKHPTDNFRPKEDPTTLTTHPATSYNIRLTKREDVCDCIKNSCVCMRLLAKNPHVRNFCPKTCVYKEGSSKKQVKDKPIKGSVNGQTYYNMRHRNKKKQRENQ